MSTFKVEVRKIKDIFKHKNADLLELGVVEGLDYQFVMQKGVYKINDLVVYFPVDSLIPQNILEIFDLGYLSGNEKNRVKTIKLRGEFSQGLVLPLNKFIENNLLDNNIELNTDVTDILGVTKYEVGEYKFESGANLVCLPDCVSVYDIEGYERYPLTIEYLKNISCCIMEKVEGTNFAASLIDNEYSVLQRNYSIKEIEGHEHTFWYIYRKKNLNMFLDYLYNIYRSNHIIIRGELCGPSIQKNIYKLQHRNVLFFDISIDKKYLDVQEFLFHIEEYNKTAFVKLETVPIIANDILLKDFLNGKTVSEVSNGKSLLNTNILREGIIIKPMQELINTPGFKDQIDMSLFDRVILKKRSPEYLAKYDF